MRERWTLLAFAVIAALVFAGLPVFGAGGDQDDEDDNFMNNTYFKRQQAKQAAKKAAAKARDYRVREELRTRSGDVVPDALKKLADRNHDGVLSKDELAVLKKYMASRRQSIREASDDGRRLVPPNRAGRSMKDEFIKIDPIRKKRVLKRNEVERELRRDLRHGYVDPDLLQSGRVESYRRNLDRKDRK